MDVLKGIKMVLLNFNVKKNTYNWEATEIFIFTYKKKPKFLNLKSMIDNMLFLIPNVARKDIRGLTFSIIVNINLKKIRPQS